MEENGFGTAAQPKGNALCTKPTLFSQTKPYWDITPSAGCNGPWHAPAPVQPNLHIHTDLWAERSMRSMMMQWSLNPAQTPTKAPSNFTLILARVKFHFLEISNFIFLAVPETSPGLQVLRQEGQAVVWKRHAISSNFYILAASLQLFCDQGKENTEVFWVGEQVLINTFESWTTVQWVFLSNKDAWQTTLSSYLTEMCFLPPLYLTDIRTVIFFLFYFKNSCSESARKLIQQNKYGCEAIKYKLENSELCLTQKTGFRYFVLKPRIKYTVSFKINHYVLSNNSNKAPQTY